MEGSIDLKSYLMSDFSNNKHKSISLIELYASDTKYYSSLEKKNLIEDEAMLFFYEKGNEILTASSIPTEAFRKLRYELIIDEYINGTKSEKSAPDKLSENPDSKDEITNAASNIPASPKQTDNQRKKTVENNFSSTKKALPEKPLHCVTDGRIIKKIDVKKITVIKTGKSFLFPRYKCPLCGKMYTSLQGYKDLQVVTLDKAKYTNINRKQEEERYIRYLQSPHMVAPGTKCYVFGTSKPVKCRKCGGAGFLFALIKTPAKKKKKKTVTYQVKFCKNCKMYHLPYNLYEAHIADWTPLNEDEIPAIKEELRIKAEEKAKRKAERKAAEALKKKEEQLQRQEEEKKRREQFEKERAAREERQRKIRESLLKQAQQLPDPALQSQKIHQHDNNIRVKDFVVRRTTFKCRHNDHKLQNIDAVINIINKEGNVTRTTVPAGYCPNCNVFFIMESTYQSLKSKGTPVCRVSDEKTYLSGNIFVNGMKLSQESVLMQYGYTVSQEEGLTSARRRKILALMIDNGVLTRSDIISYLDFFINQRKNQHRFEKAIEKWESDREFVSEYKTGNYSKYGVSGIYRKF